MHVVRNNDILHISVCVCPSKMIQRKFVEVIQSHFKSIILFPLRGNSLTENIILQGILILCTWKRQAEHWLYLKASDEPYPFILNILEPVEHRCNGKCHLRVKDEHGLSSWFPPLLLVDTLKMFFFVKCSQSFKSYLNLIFCLLSISAGLQQHANRWMFKKCRLMKLMILYILLN